MHFRNIFFTYLALTNAKADFITAEIFYKGLCMPSIKVTVDGQSVSLGIDTALPFTWIISDTVQELVKINEKLGHVEKFNYTSFAKQHPDKIVDGSGNVTSRFQVGGTIAGNIVDVPLWLKGSNLKVELTVMSVNWLWDISVYLKLCQISGFLGLALLKETKYGKTNFMRTIARHDSQFSSEMVALKPGINGKGTLIIGNYNSELRQRPVTTCDLESNNLPDQKWHTKINVVVKMLNRDLNFGVYQDDLIAFDTGCAAVLPVTEHNYYGIKKFFEQNYGVVFGNNAPHDKRFYCNTDMLKKFPRIIITFACSSVGSEVEYPLAVKDYVEIINNGRCKLLFSIKDPNSQVLSIGVNFFKRYFVGVHGKARKITFANTFTATEK